MEVELRSDWLVDQIELMKTLHGYEMKEINKEIGSIDYVADDDQGEKLLRVLISSGLNAGKADFNTTTKIVESLEKEGYEEITIIAEDFTEASLRILEENEINYFSPTVKPRYSVFELMEAIQRLTHELCRAKCGIVPAREVDCKGYQEGEYTCPVRVVSDNADFHAERGWQGLLKRDFSQLIDIKKEMNEGEED